MIYASDQLRKQVFSHIAGMTKTLRQEAYEACILLLESKITYLRNTLDDLTTGAEDSKSSAGDKHETARAMMQLEHEKVSRQLDECRNQLQELMKTSLTFSEKIIHGSLVKANDTYLFVSVPLGKITAGNISVMAISAKSPVGLQMMGKKAGHTFQINEVKYLIEEVF